MPFEILLTKFMPLAETKGRTYADLDILFVSFRCTCHRHLIHFVISADRN